MEQAHKDILDRHRNELIRDMGSARVVDHLISVKVFDHEDEYEISGQRDREAKNRELLKILIKKPLSYGHFVAALKATQQYKLADLLEKDGGQGAVHQAQQDAAAAHPVGLLQKFEQLTEHQLKDRLTSNLTYLTGQLKSSPVINSLHEQKVFTAYVVEEIETVPGPQNQNRKLYDNLIVRPKNDLLKFINILISTNQEHIAEKLAEGL